MSGPAKLAELAENAELETLVKAALRSSPGTRLYCIDELGVILIAPSDSNKVALDQAQAVLQLALADQIENRRLN